ncbi:YadA-like family protein [Paraburkholderia sp. SOS3]|uniref:YadA-like family protein n=1 Tax=Paraburkholderia sp. SOS3 TaxID=1926494 RepID=UPI001E3889E8|nr:YadA-like family protein [Paraburkholderia sp. SOS3]
MSMSGYLDVWKTATFHGGVDLKGNTISNLANGSADGDAVNVAQLKAAGLNVDTSGNVTGAFVAYDDTAKGKITLAGGTAGTAITNVKAGALSASSTDAVNGAQLYGTASSTAAALGGNSSVNTDGTIRKPSYNVAGSTYSDVGSALAAVDAKAGSGSIDGIKYDSSAHDKVTFSGTKGTTLSNVNAGSADKDAVNVAQLKAAGLNVDTSGNVANSFVAYDDTTKGKITLAGGTAGTTITNVKAGALSASSTDAVNGSQLFATNANVTNVTNTVNSITNGGGIKYFHVNSTAADSSASSAGDIAIGANASASRAGYNAQGNSIGIGTNAAGQGINSIAIGNGASTNTGALYTGASSIAMGAGSFSEGSGAIAIGNGSNAGFASGVDTNAVALGTSAYAKSSSSTALGANASVKASNSTAVGTSASATGANAVALGASSVADRDNSVSVGSTSTQRQIVNMAKGTADTDAVNVSQLKGVATALGGGAAVNADGTIKAPTYTVQGQTKNDVGSALAAIDTATTGNTTSITNLTNNINNGAVGLVQQDATSKAITVAKATAGTTVDFTGTAGTRQLKGVSKGTADTDAVNLAQLKAAGLNVDTSGNVTGAFVSYDDATKGKITLAGGTAGTTITNLKAGAISATSKDAVNGSQLYSLASSEAAALGGGSVVNADGSISKPTYTVDGKSVNGVDGAVSALDTRITDATSSNAQISDKLKYVKFGQTSAMDATASGQDAVAIGGYAQAIGDNTLAIGSQSRAMGTNSVAIGYGSSTTQANTFAVGSSTSKRRIVNVADATGVSDAVTLGQMNTAIGAAITSSGVKNNGMLGASTMLLGATQSSKTPDQLIVSGPTTLSTPTDALGKNGIAMGLNAHANADNAVAAGQNVSVLGSNGVAVGQNIAVGADSAVGIGVGTSVASENAVAIGSNGTEVNTGAANAVAIGSGVSVGGQNSVGIGSNIVVGTANSVVLGANSSDDNRANTVSVGSSAVPGMGTSLVRRQVINVAAGTQDYDAVNVSQLKGVTSTLGGGAGVNTDGSIKKPSYTVAGGTYTDVGSALAAVDTKAGTGSVDAVKYDSSAHNKVTFSGTSGTTLTNVNAGTADKDAVNVAQLKAAGLNIDTSGNATNSFVAYDDTTMGKVTLGGGTAGTTITNVKAGALSASSTDAVNGAQLYATNQNVSSINTQITNINGKMADAVMYDSSSHDKVTLGGGTAGTTIANLKAGKADTDAVNLAQLKAAGLNVDTSGNVTNSFVAYDDTSMGKVTLGGGSAGTTITNVKAGALSASSTDAVNGAQLYATNQNVSSINTQITNINGKMADAVMYDSSSHDKVTLGGGTAGTTIANLKAGKADTDAVNLAQLKAAGLNVDTSGNVTNSFVAYDDTSMGKVTLGGGTAGTTITNVKAGAVTSTSKDAINGSQLYGTASSTAAALGGGSSVDANGKITKPTYNVAGSTYGDVGSALAAVDAKAASGSVDGVKYDSSAHDTVTFSGTSGTKLSNVTAGTADTDAVNLAQLKAAGLNVDTSGNVTNSFVAYDDTTMGKVTLGGGTAGTTITNVKAGAVSSTSKDAINGSQLYSEANSIATALGGGAAVNTDGTIKAPTYTVQGQTKSDVGSALAAIDTATTGNTTSITNLTNNINNGKIGLVQQDAATKTITVAKATDGTTVDFTGTAGARQLKGVSAGKADTDAVNMAQLKAAGLNVDTSGNVTNSFVAYDDSTKGTITLAGGTAGTTITNLKAGAVGASSTDAINGSQLYSLASSEAAAFGGGSTVNADGTISMPEYTVGGKTVDGVDGAVTALDTRITDMSSAMTEITPKLKYIKFGDTNALDATAAGADAVAIGGFAQAMGDGALAIGANARAMATNSVAIGYGSSTSQANTFAVGSTTSKRRIVNVADGTSISDAVTVGQMNTAIGAAITSAGVKNNGMLGASTMLLGATSSKTPDQLIVSGPTTLSTPTDALGKNAIAMGLNAHANADNAVAAGQNVSVLGSNGVAVGQNIAVGADSAVGIGSTVSAASINSVAIGSNGTEVNTGSDNSVAIGSNVSIGGKNTVGIGSNIVAGTEGSVVLGANSSDDNRANTVSVGSSAVPGMGTSLVRRQVINVAAGTQDYDAVNVSQLKGVTSTLGGGAGVNTDGSIKKPSYTVAGSTYSDVGSALAAVDAKAATGSVDGVKYDSSAHDKVTFSGTSGTTLSNVNAGSADTDAVNVAQLKAAGLNIDTSGTVTNSFVAYDDATKTKITMAGGTAGTTITNVKAGDLSASSTDAVNGAQLYATNQNVSSLTTQITNINGKMADAVMYDSSAHDKVTLGGGTAGTTITNVKAGGISAASTDAVNGSQLYGTASSTAAALGGNSSVNADGTIRKPSYNVAGSTYSDVGSALAAVDAKAATGSVDGIKYDTSAHDKVTFSGTNGTTLSNVNAGSADKDAVNVAQLKAAGLNIDTSGNVTNSFVSYDDATKGKITLGGGTAGTTIANVKAGAVNATSKDAVNGSQLYNVANSTATALGGGSTVNADGSISAPTYSLNEGSTKVHTVGDAISNLDGRVTQNTGDITDIKNTLIDGGVIDGSTGKSLAVVYDNADKDSVTFGGKGTTAPVALHNVAAGVADTDAVNMSQLNATNTRIDNINYNMGNIGDAVMYDSSTHDRLTLGGLAGGTMTAPVILTNVADGTSKYDAVNFGQLSALQGQVTNLDNRVTVVEGQVINQGGGGGSWNNDAGGKKITNVAAGTETTDAVNVGQLNDAVADAHNYTDSRVGDLPDGMTAKDYTDQSMKSMQSQVNSVAKNAYGGIAAATALTMIPDVDQGKTIAVGVGTGNYKGYQAVALGASARITQNLKVKIGAGMAPGNGTTIGAGASYQW